MINWLKRLFNNGIDNKILRLKRINDIKKYREQIRLCKFHLGSKSINDFLTTTSNPYLFLLSENIDFDLKWCNEHLECLYNREIPEEWNITEEDLT